MPKPGIYLEDHDNGFTLVVEWVRSKHNGVMWQQVLFTGGKDAAERFASRQVEMKRQLATESD